MIRAGIRRLFRLGIRRDDVLHADVETEIETHLALRTAQLTANGLTPADARAEAIRRFGSRDLGRQTVTNAAHHREKTMRVRERIEAVRQDVTYAARGLRREPLLTAFITATFALGIGANAAMFGVVDRLMLRGPMYVTDPDRVVRLYITEQPSFMRTPFTTAVFGYVTYDIMRTSAKSFDGVAAYSISEKGATFGKGENAVAIDVGAATADLFPLLGTHAYIGRFFTPNEDRTSGAEHVVVLGYGFWKRTFGGDRDILGKTALINGESYTIVGVAPNGFTGPELGRVEAWLPMSARSSGIVADWWASWNAQWLRVVARFKPGVTPEQANTDITAAFRHAYTGTEQSMRVATLAVKPLISSDDAQEPPEVAVARWLVGVAAIVLLIACSNIINLLLARAVRRRREVAVRIALGAGRRRVVRLLVTESLMFAALGGVASVAVAFGAGQLLRSVLLPNVEWVSSPVSGPLLAVSAAIAVTLGIVIGLVPALQISRPDLSTALKAGVREGGGHSWRLRSTLTVAQSALSVVLLIGAGLFVASLARIRAIDLGIEPDRVLVTEIDWPRIAVNATADARKAERARRAEVYQLALERARALAGVAHASLAVGLPFQYRFSQHLRVPGWDTVPQLKSGGPKISAVSSQYFDVTGTRVVRGRAFTDADRAGSEPLAIVSETMARTIWPNADPIGQCLYTGDEPAPCSRIVGIAHDAHRSQLREAPGMHYYIPFGQERGIGGTVLLTRPAGSAAATIAAVRQIVLKLDPSVSIVSTTLLQDSLDPQIRPWRLGATVFGLMGVLALIVAAVGLYSVMSYLVAQRTHELGIRVALGASARNIVGLVMRGGIGMAGAGVGIGLVAALALGRFIQPLLFETSPRDLTVMACVAGSLLAVAAVATLVPALRAKRVNPITALNAE